MFDFQTLTAADLRDPEISGIIASKMKEFHDLDMPGSKKIALWDRVRCALFRTTISFHFSRAIFRGNSRFMIVIVCSYMRFCATMFQKMA